MISFYSFVCWHRLKPNRSVAFSPGFIFRPCQERIYKPKAAILRKNENKVDKGHAVMRDVLN